ncbi:MAG TPA: biotin/lipoyl-containing protein [Thermoanaerobaculia bacterium]
MSEKIVTIGGDTKKLDVERDGDTFRAGSHEVTIVAIRGNTAELRIDGRTRIVPFVVQGTAISFALDGESYVVEVAERASRSKARHRAHSMSAPMPGVVLKILTSAGDVVAKGAPLIILEAMKMEHAIVAPYDGRVTAVNCQEGELVQPGNDLIELDQHEDSSR